MSAIKPARAGAPLCLLAALLAAQAAPAADRSGSLETVIVTGTQVSPITTSVPAVVESLSDHQIENSVNLMTSAEALKYLPSIEVRERYIGDRNSIVSTRTTGTVSSAESLVYADGLLLSNLLGNSYSYPPRWGVVAPNEIERVDVIYGPFSALYPGNSMGGVINIVTRMPQRREIHASITGALEGFSLYGTHQKNGSADANLALGDRIGKWSFWIDYDHLDAHGHPMSFSTANLSAMSPAPGATPVTGAYRDIDQTGQPRLVFGAYSIDHTVQDTGTVRLGYDIAPTVRILYTLALWADRSDTGVQSFLTSAATGAPFYNGPVDIGGKGYAVSGLKPGVADELQVLNALSVGSNSGGMFDWQVSASSYDYLTERSHSASAYGQSSSGTDQKQDGTGWITGDVKGVWRGWSSQEIVFGYHIDRYRLRQVTFDTADWTGGPDGSLNSASRGNTETQALYIQDAWRFHPRWTLTLGGREEFWRASDGSNTDMSVIPNIAHYPDQSRSAFSPKAAIAFAITQSLRMRFSYGRAVRFPTVGELYQQVTNGTELLQNNPDLKPETVNAYDWTTQYAFPSGDARLSLFQENINDALFSQTDTSVSPNITQIENIGAVRIRGVEAAFEESDTVVPGLVLMGSLTYADSAVLSDFHAPAAVGKQWPRIPRWRARFVATYRQNGRLIYSVGYRYASGAFSQLLNTDVNHDTYGGISPYSVVDVKVSYRLGRGITASVGVDNVTGTRYFVSPHPYPQTTGFISLRYDN